MLRRCLLASLFAGACSLVACTPTYPKCDKDEHCKADGHNEVCVNGMCQECGKDGDCKAGFACKESKCAPKAECGPEGGCQSGFKCKDEKCVPECIADADCTNGLSCKAGRCAPAAECASDADCTAGKKCDPTQRCVEALGTDACKLGIVRFDFNEATLTSEGRRVLDQNAECLKSKKGTFMLAGHCDERGTEEYNLHLGERRANSVKKYLSALGIDPKNLKTVSYGKERPVNPGHDEAAWSENRRVEVGNR